MTHDTTMPPVSRLVPIGNPPIISRRKAYRLVADGTLTLYKVGSRSFLDVAEIDALVQRAAR